MSKQQGLPSHGISETHSESAELRRRIITALDLDEVREAVTDDELVAEVENREKLRAEIHALMEGLF